MTNFMFIKGYHMKISVEIKTGFEFHNIIIIICTIKFDHLHPRFIWPLICNYSYYTLD